MMSDELLDKLRESVHWMVTHTSNIPTKHIQVMDDAHDEIRRLRAAVEFYANRDHWMSNTENGDAQLLIAHGKNFDGTSNGWVEAAAALESKGL